MRRQKALDYITRNQLDILGVLAVEVGFISISCWQGGWSTVMSGTGVCIGSELCSTIRVLNTILSSIRFRIDIAQPGATVRSPHG